MREVGTSDFYVIPADSPEEIQAKLLTRRDGTDSSAL